LARLRSWSAECELGLRLALSSVFCRKIFVCDVWHCCIDEWIALALLGAS